MGFTATCPRYGTVFTTETESHPALCPRSDWSTYYYQLLKDFFGHSRIYFTWYRSAGCLEAAHPLSSPSGIQSVRYSVKSFAC